MADMKISELSSVASLNNGDLIEVSQVDSSSPTGYTSMKASMKDVGDKVVNEIQYTQELDTSAKKITGAINELVSDLASKAVVVDLGNIGAATKKLTFPGVTVRYLVVSSGGSNGRMGAWWVMSRSSSISYIGELLNSNVVSLSSANDGELVISSTTANTYVQLLLIVGSPSDFVIT